MIWLSHVMSMFISIFMCRGPKKGSGILPSPIHDYSTRGSSMAMEQHRSHKAKRTPTLTPASTATTSTTHTSPTYHMQLRYKSIQMMEPCPEKTDRYHVIFDFMCMLTHTVCVLLFLCGAVRCSVSLLWLCL